jgi:hypothetical protein
MGDRSGGPTTGGRRNGTPHPARRHRAAMQLSAAVLLLAFLMPPFGRATMGEGSDGAAARGQRAGTSHPVLRHLGAMHLSGAILVLTFLVPPFWTDAAYAAPPDDPTADAPFVLALVVPVVCVSFHVMVQIPAGLLGTWLNRSRTARARYGSAVGVASALSLLLVWSLYRNDWGSLVPVWADTMARVCLGLAGYVWVMRVWPGSVRQRHS